MEGLDKYLKCFFKEFRYSKLKKMQIYLRKNHPIYAGEICSGYDYKDCKIPK